MYVYVAAKNGKPLMPTKRIGHVWDLLQAGKAKLSISALAAMIWQSACVPPALEKKFLQK